MLRPPRIGHHLGQVAQIGEAEERGDRRVRHHVNGACALLHLVPGGVQSALLHRCLQVGMGPCVAADGVACGKHHLENFRMIGRMLADREEGCTQALVGERLQHRGGISGPRAIIEGQHDFVVPQEVVALEMLGAEAGTAGGVDLDHAGHAHGVWIGASDGLRRRSWTERREGCARGRRGGLGWLCRGCCGRWRCRSLCRRR